jgi:DNA helicase HerA-like ATPase
MRHVGIFGQTGSGKTNIAFQLIQTLTEQGIPFLVFDWKRNFRDLLLKPELKDKLRIYTAGRNVAPFHFNPKNAPPNSDAESYQKKLCEIIEWAYFLGQGAHDIIMETYDKGNFAEMRDYLMKQRKQGREMLWWASGKRTLNALNFGELGAMLNHPRPHNMAKLLKQSVILELDGLTEADKCFVAGSILNWIMEYRRSQQDREVLKHVLIIEEAHHLFRKKAETKPEDITDTIFREVREYGQALIILDQHPHRTSTQALGNSGTIVALKTTLAQDRKALSQSMLLQRFEEHYPGLLNPGAAIVKNPRIPRPFLINVPKYDIQKGTVTDQQLKQAMNRTGRSGNEEALQLPVT